MPGGDPGEFPGIAPSPPPALPRSLWLLRLPPCATTNLRVPPALLSLRYPHVAVPEPGPGLPQFVSMGSLDGIPSRRRRSERGQAEPQAPGMANAGFWGGKIWEHGNSHGNSMDGSQSSHSHGNSSPDVHVSGKAEHGILTLSCHAYGFYPSTIGISWMKGMKSGIVPNRDSTFHPWAGIEEEREQHRCWVEHLGMPEIGIFSWGGSPCVPSLATLGGPHQPVCAPQISSAAPP
uniref:Uncharacterized protein n=1 Tax=Corvus moneduloides TaxID=1196302 RepID=A0A8C3DZ46_CORMO